MLKISLSDFGKLTSRVGVGRLQAMNSFSTPLVRRWVAFYVIGFTKSHPGRSSIDRNARFTVNSPQNGRTDVEVLMLDQGVWAEVKVGGELLRLFSEQNAIGVQASVYNVTAKNWDCTF